MIERENKIKKHPDGSFEMLCPIGLPAEGIQDFVDDLAAKTKYPVISAPAVVSWLKKSDFNVFPPLTSSCWAAPKILGGKFDEQFLAKNIASGWPKLVKDLCQSALSRRASVIMHHPTSFLSRSAREKMLKHNFKDAKCKKKAIVFVGSPDDAFRNDQIAKEIERLTNDKNPEPTLPDDFVFRQTKIGDASSKITETLVLADTTSLPSTEEGFDEITYAWSSTEEAQKHFDKWRDEKKLTIYVDDLKPSNSKENSWFREKLDEWMKKKFEWKRSQSEYEQKKKKLVAEKEEEIKKLKNERIAVESKRRQAESRRKRKFEEAKRAYEATKKKAEEDGQDFNEEEPVKEEPPPEEFEKI